MTQSILIWVALIISIEAIIEIIVNGDIFLSFRNFLVKVNPSFLGKLVSCPYCLSVWVAATHSWMLPGSISSVTLPNFEYCYIIDFVLKTFIAHRLSNLWHGLSRRIIEKSPFELVMTHINVEQQSETLTASTQPPTATWGDGDEQVKT